jgi:hypothetical protein
MNEPYEKHILDLQEVGGFVEFFYRMLTHHNNHELCYDACEEFYIQYFGKRRFADYECFRVQKSKYLKNKAKIK